MVASVPLPPPAVPAQSSAAVTPRSTEVVLAATTTTTAGGEGGPAGTYGATSLKPAGSWAEGGSSGSFTYSYPVSLPSASSALVPSVALTYDSGSVDGQTAATQAQAGWAGDGWSTGDSSIQQTFVPCADSPEGTTLLAAVQGERRWRGGVFAGERGFRGGSGCGLVGCDDTVSVSDMGRPSPLPFREARGGP
jgi:hypothetical protein